MTNENKDERNPADLDSTQWGPDDVAEWFTPDGSTVEHRWVFLFQHNSGEVFGIHVEKYRVFAFGPTSLSLPTCNLWEEYVENGDVRFGYIHLPFLSPESQLAAEASDSCWLMIDSTKSM